MLTLYFWMRERRLVNCWGEMMGCCCDDDDDDNDELLLLADVKEEVEGEAVIEFPEADAVAAAVVVATTVSSCSLLSLPSSDEINEVISVAALDDFGEC